MGVDKLNFSILESGFLPNKISTLLSNEFDDVEHIAKNLPKILANNQIKDEVLNLETEKDISNLSIDELEEQCYFTLTSVMDTSGEVQV